MTAAVLALGLAAVAAYGLPALALAALWPTIEAGRFTVRNYRGKDVAPALWVAFPVWAIGVSLLQVGLYFDPFGWSDAVGSSGLTRGFEVLASLSALVGVAIGALLFGLIDDVWGGKDAKGFRGHLGSLGRGRLTTGGLKLLGIGSVAFVGALGAVLVFSRDTPDSSAAALGITVLLGTLITALSANAVNLADLRPGRALKAGFVLLVVALLSVAVRCVTDGVSVAGSAAAVGLAGVLLGGPMLAMWPYDVQERGMLGDAGANAVGAALGHVIFVGLAPAGFEGSVPALAVLATIACLMLLVNLMSERVSYSALIERHGFLRRLDRLGRPTFDEAPAESPRNKE